MTSLRTILRRWFGASGEAGGRGPRAPEWPALPPLETVTGSIDLVAESRSFANGLTGRAPLCVAARELTHGAGLDAPRGKVAGVPVFTRRRSGPLTSLRRRRRTAERPAPVPVWEENPEPGAAMDAIEAPAEDSTRRGTPPAAGRPEPAGSDVAKPDAGKPEAGKPHAAKPHTAKPHTAKPHAAKPHAAKSVPTEQPRPAFRRRASRRVEGPAPGPASVGAPLPVVPGKTARPVAAKAVRGTQTPQALGTQDASPAAPSTAVPVPRGSHVAALRDRPLTGSPSRAPIATEAPPPAVRAAVERAFGVDLGHVRVHRGERSAGLAEKIGAQAFAVRDEVHVPARHGGLESERGAPLLAHELAHAAQHARTRRGERPRSETTLEHEARSAEEAWRPAASPRAASIAAPAPAPRLPEPGPHSRGPAPSPPAAPVQAPAPTPSTATSRPDPIRRAVAAPGGDTPDAAPLPIDELVRHLYERIRSRLRAELLVDRERAGTLTDLRVR